MFKTLVYINIIVILFSIFSCSSGRPKEIPDDELKDMLVDIAFINNYAREEMVFYKKDTLSIFEPIFEKYGYTVKDLEYTFEQLISRKSNVATVLINETLKELDKLKNDVQFRAELKRKWEEKGRDMFKEVLYEKNTPKELTSVESIKNFVIKVPRNKKGNYKLTYQVRVDSADKNSLRYLRFLERDSVTKKIDNQRSVWITGKFNSYQKIEHEVTINDIDSNVNELVYELIYLGRNVLNKNTSIKVDSVKLMFFPSNEDAGQKYKEKLLGIDSLDKLLIRIKNEIDEKDIHTFYDKWGGIDSLSNN